MKRACQFLDGSWDGYEPHCYDINECALPYPVCDPDSLCFNTIGSWECSPYLVDGTLIAINDGGGRARNITDGGVELLDNNGGQMIQFMIVRGKGDIPVTQIQWTSELFYEIACTSIIRRNLDSPFEAYAILTCTIDSGAGRSFHGILTFDSHGRTGMTPRLGADRLNYPLAIFVANTLRLSDQSKGAASSELIFPTRNAYNISVDVLNLGSHLRLRTGHIFFGPWWSPNQYQCHIYSITITTITCITEKDAYGNLLRLMIPFGDSDDDRSFSADSLSFPVVRAPRVLWVKGCTDVGNTTVDCPTTGNVTLYLQVERRPKEPCQVLIAGHACIIIGRVENEFITCLLPEGAGKRQPVVIVEPGSVGDGDRLVSYASPEITKITGCQGSSTGSSTTINGCHRTGGDEITLIGENFGSNGATLFIGTTPCLQSRQNESEPHSIAYCITPPGVDSSLVLLLQEGGSVSTTPITVVHALCNPGHETNYSHVPTSTDPSCLPCPQGMISEAGEICHLCPPMTIANATGMSRCLTCAAGRFERERKRCDPCEPGAIGVSGGCVLCTEGKYAAEECEDCPIGRLPHHLISLINFSALFLFFFCGAKVVMQLVLVLFDVIHAQVELIKRQQARKIVCLVPRANIQLISIQLLVLHAILVRHSQ
jgi:hypothetical protein